MRRRAFIHSLIAPAAFGFSGCEPSSSDSSGMSPAVSASVFRTFAIGRFVIDLPDHFRLLPNGSIRWTIGKTSDFYRIELKIIRSTGTKPSFDEILAARTGELKDRHHNHAPGNSMLIASRRVGADASSPTIVRSYTDAGLMDAFTCEVFFERNDTVGVLTQEIFTPESPLKPDAVEAQLVALTTRFRSMDAASEKAPGLGLGSLLVDASFDGEDVSAAFRSTLWPEVLITVSSRSLLNELDGGLLKRVDRSSALLTAAGFRSKVLRRGATTLGGAPAEELLESGKDQGKTVRSFMSEVLLEQPATKARPLLTLGMRMGGQVGFEYVEPQVSEEDSLALWDRVRSSIRIRSSVA